MITDFTLEYKGYGIHPSHCGIRIDRQNAITVTMTEVADNPGTSVTNAVETIAELILLHLGLPISEHAKVRWVEHYPPRGNFAESFDQVRFTYDEHLNRLRAPIWSRMRGQV